MADTRKIRIEYFQVVKIPIGEDRGEVLFCLEKLILKASKMNIEDRTYRYYQEKARLDKFKYNSNCNYWYLNFVRLRQHKLPVMAKETEESIPMELATDEYIGEDVSAVYDCDNHILALQRNRDSLSSNGIEQYLTELLASENYGIFLRPIPMEGIFNKANKAKIVRKITLKFATSMKEKTKNLGNSSFAALFDYFSGYNSNIATLSVSLGQQKKGTLDLDTVHKALDDINKTEGVVTGAELTVKYSEEDPVDTIDLFTMKYHNFISIKIEDLKSIDFISMADEIHIKYNMCKQEVLDVISHIN